MGRAEAKLFRLSLKCQAHFHLIGNEKKSTLLQNKAQTFQIVYMSFYRWNVNSLGRKKEEDSVTTL